VKPRREGTSTDGRHRIPPLSFCWIQRDAALRGCGELQSWYTIPARRAGLLPRTVNGDADLFACHKQIAGATGGQQLAIAWSSPALPRRDAQPDGNRLTHGELREVIFAQNPTTQSPNKKLNPRLAGLI